jgi:N-methylhydantoinase A
MAASFSAFVAPGVETSLAAFGGGGPMSACSAARIAGVRNVLVPRLAAVFSAYGISFSDIAQSYETHITGFAAEAIEAVRAKMISDAGRDMFQEGHEIADCELVWTTVVEDSGTILNLKAIFRLPRPSIAGGRTAAKTPAVSAGVRFIRSGAGTVDAVPVFVLADQAAGASAAGPAIVEGPFFTARVPGGWELDVSVAGDLLLTDIQPVTTT